LLVLRPSDVPESFRDACLDRLQVPSPDGRFPRGDLPSPRHLATTKRNAPLPQALWPAPPGSVYEIATVKDRSKALAQPPPQLLRGPPLLAATADGDGDGDADGGGGGGVGILAVAEHGVWCALLRPS
jgi:hypothetical protein